LPIRVSHESSLDRARCLGVYTFESFTQRVIDGPGESTEALVAVACGEVDIAVIRMCGHKIWDVAFASLLVSEAGGCVSDENGSPLRLLEFAPTFEWIIATNGRLHPAALKWFAETIGMR
jgi:fructose-1,6-bisphosphatase/inositol monophosphatase family enzyme